MIEMCVDDLAFSAGEAIRRLVNADLPATTRLLRRLEAAAGNALQAQLRKHDALEEASVPSESLKQKGL
ncbi:MAG: hypothetical protein ABR499_02830 [Gemmatimonadaceae bacterium]